MGAVSCSTVTSAHTAISERRRIFCFVAAVLCAAEIYATAAVLQRVRMQQQESSTQHRPVVRLD